MNLTPKKKILNTIDIYPCGNSFVEFNNGLWFYIRYDRDLNTYIKTPMSDKSAKLYLSIS